MSRISVPSDTGPLRRYRQAVSNGVLLADDAQAEAISLLQNLYSQINRRSRSRLPWLTRFRVSTGRSEVIKGLYFWGGVGRGKTCLMDMFFQSLNGVKARRMHFHRFMKMVHEDLNRLRGTANPLQVIGKQLASEAEVLCFDEFFVSDIGDAMLLAGLLETLFEEDVVLVATSNIPPHRLYENGLQRQQFVPAIKLIEAHTRVVNLDGGRDYRLRNLEKAGLYFTPADQGSDVALMECFTRLAGQQVSDIEGSLEILGRQVKYKRRTEGLIWFDFAELCETPRSALDYIELACQYHTVLISGVPVFDPQQDDGARRFISLVDEFYDRNVKVVISATAEPEQLYSGTELAFAFERTASRLREMQSHEYLGREHLP